MQQLIQDHQEMDPKVDHNDAVVVVVVEEDR